jgi:hypothetical protein
MKAPASSRCWSRCSSGCAMEEKRSAQVGNTQSAVVRRQAALVLALGALLLLLAAMVSAQGYYDLSWYVVSGGGGYAYPPPQALHGAVVQPAGVMRGGSYELQSGFLVGMWSGAPGTGIAYLPIIMKGF